MLAVKGVGEVAGELGLTGARKAVEEEIHRESVSSVSRRRTRLWP